MSNTERATKRKRSPDTGREISSKVVIHVDLRKLFVRRRTVDRRWNIERSRGIDKVGVEVEGGRCWGFPPLTSARRFLGILTSRRGDPNLLIGVRKAQASRPFKMFSRTFNTGTISPRHHLVSRVLNNKTLACISSMPICTHSTAHTLDAHDVCGWYRGVGPLCELPDDPRSCI